MLSSVIVGKGRLRKKKNIAENILNVSKFNNSSINMIQKSPQDIEESFDL